MSTSRRQLVENHRITFLLAAAAAYNHTLEPLDKKLSKYLGGNPIRIDGKPRASGILDTVRCPFVRSFAVLIIEIRSALLSLIISRSHLNLRTRV